MVDTDNLFQISQALGRIDSRLTGIEVKIDDLTGDHGRIANLEKAQDRQWWMTMVIGPALVGLHAIARKLGINA